MFRADGPQIRLVDYELAMLSLKDMADCGPTCEFGSTYRIDLNDHHILHGPYRDGPPQILAVSRREFIDLFSRGYRITDSEKVRAWLKGLHALERDDTAVDDYLERLDALAPSNG